MRRALRFVGLMHTALYHLLPPPPNCSPMLAAIRQRAGAAAAAGAAFLPHPLFAVTASRADQTARGVSLRQTASAAESVEYDDAQPYGTKGITRGFVSHSSRSESAGRHDLYQGSGRGFRQQGAEGGRSFSGRSSRGGGSSRGRRSSSAGRVGTDGGPQEQDSGSLTSRAGAGRSGSGRSRGARVFGGLRAAGSRRTEVMDDVSQRSLSLSAADEDFTGSGSGRQRGRASTRGRDGGGRGESRSGRRGPAGAPPWRAEHAARPSGPAQQRAAVATPSMGAASAAMHPPYPGPYPDPDPVPRNAGITGGRWDDNDAALVAQSLKDAETLRRKFADQGASVNMSRLFCRCTGTRANAQVTVICADCPSNCDTCCPVWWREWLTIPTINTHDGHCKAPAHSDVCHPSPLTCIRKTRNRMP